jgi:hypothetical protein
MKRLVLAATAVAGGFVALGGTAFAAPSNAPRATPIDLTCDGISYQVVAPPGGNSMQSRSFTPAIIVGGGALIPTTLSITFPFGTFTQTRALNNPHANDVTCTGTAFAGTPQEFSVNASGFAAPSSVRHP